MEKLYPIELSIILYFSITKEIWREGNCVWIPGYACMEWEIVEIWSDAQSRNAQGKARYNATWNDIVLGAWLGDRDRSNTGIANLVGPGIVDWRRRYAAFLRMRALAIPPTSSVSYHIVKYIRWPLSRCKLRPRSQGEDFVYIPNIGDNNLLTRC